ncbi:hypothetical protein Lal_00050185 [Lupinus albus]|nr:hypothetical protein Lal_00050185 [Lupinus albus]
MDFINLHSMHRTPVNGIGMKIFSWVKPKVELLFSFTFPLGVNISMNYKLILGLKARARFSVKGQSNKLTIVHNLTPSISPSNINILVQVSTSKSNHRKGRY